MAAEEKLISRTACSHMKDIENNLTLETLKHIASCDICAAAYAGIIEKHSLMSAPYYLKNNILQESKVLSEIQKRKKKINLQLNRKHLQLFRYSMKIGLAMCMALVILFLAPSGSTAEGKPSGIIYFLDKMDSGLRKFSYNMAEYTDSLIFKTSYNKEDIKNDK